MRNWFGFITQTVLELGEKVQMIPNIWDIVCMRTR